VLSRFYVGERKANVLGLPAVSVRPCIVSFKDVQGIRPATVLDVKG
jgi:hypothetical protein